MSLKLTFKPSAYIVTNYARASNGAFFCATSLVPTKSPRDVCFRLLSCNLKLTERITQSQRPSNKLQFELISLHIT